MKVTELRIGNLYFHEPTNDYDEVRKNTFDLIERNPECYKPIPLTEEWLIKFGFEDNQKVKGVKYIDGVIAIDCIRYGKGWCLANDEYHPNIKYVHQLQNLYFALTGEELTIKE